MSRKKAVSPVIGILLILVLVIAVAGLASNVVFETTTQTDAPSSQPSFDVNYISESIIEIQLIKDAGEDVILRSSLGTIYQLNSSGDSVQITNQNTNITPALFTVNEDGSRTLIREIPPQSFTADKIVRTNEDLQSAINRADENDTISIQRGEYGQINVTESVSLVGEDGVKVELQSPDRCVVRVKEPSSLVNLIINGSGESSSAVHAVCTEHETLGVTRTTLVETGGTSGSQYDGQVEEESSSSSLLFDTDGVDPSTNTDPTVSDIDATIPEDGTLSRQLDVQDSDNSTFTYDVLSKPSNGDVQISSSGLLQYTPDTNYFGTDSLTVQVFDGADGTDTATVDIIISSVNDAPVASDDLFQTEQGTVVSGNVLSNDNDVDDTDLTVSKLTGVSDGTLSLSSDGTFTYSPDEKFSGTDSFTYSVSDGSKTDSGVVTIEVRLNQTDSVTETLLSDGSLISLDVDGNLEPQGPSENNQPTVTFEGNGFKRNETVSATGVSSGESIQLGVDGNLPAVGSESANPTVTFEGKGFNRTKSKSADGFGDEDVFDIGVNGNLDATGASDGEPTVIFEGNGFENQRNVSASDVSDGGVVSLDVSGNQPALGPSNGNPTVTFEGNGFENQRTVSQSAVSDGGTVGLNVDGNLPATGPGSNGNPTVTFEGDGFDRRDDYSQSGVSLTTSKNIGVDGNLQPVGPSGGEPKLSVTVASGGSTTSSRNGGGSGVTSFRTAFVAAPLAGDTANNNRIKSTRGILSETSMAVDELKISSLLDPVGSDYGFNVEVRIDEGEVDESYGEGQKVATWSPTYDTSLYTIQFSQPYQVSANQPYEVEFITKSTDGDGTADQIPASGGGSVITDTSEIGLGFKSDGTDTISSSASRIEIIGTQGGIDSLSASDGAGKTVSFGSPSVGDTVTKGIDLSTSSSKIDFSGSGDGTIDWELKMRERQATVNPSVDVDGDGTSEASVSQNLFSGETVTREINLNLSDDTATVQTAGGTVDVTFQFTERKGTINPKVDLNNDGVGESSVSGVLLSGEKATKEIGLSPSDNNATILTDGGSADVKFNFTEKSVTSNPGVDIDGDSVAEANFTGNLLEGETVARDIPSLSPTDDSAEVLIENGTVDLTFNYTERKATIDPQIDVNSDGVPDASFNGVLFDGQTATAEISNLTPKNDTAVFNSVGGKSNLTFEFKERKASLQPGIDIDNDGNVEAGTSRNLFENQTSTVELSELTTATDAAQIRSNGGLTNVTIEWRERSST